MQETVMFIILIGVVGFVGTIIFAGWFQNQTISALSAISQKTYEELSEINSLANATNFTCVGPFQTFTVTPQGLIEMQSLLAYKNAVEFTGGVPSKGIIYYSGSYMFVVAPYPIQPGSFSNTKICVVPSSTGSPALIEEPAT